METSSNMRCYKFYFEDENSIECSEVIYTQTLDEAKKLFSNSFDHEIIKISEFPRDAEGSIPNVVYYRDCD